VSGHQFCRKHSSHFCPCASPWLYGAAAKAAYERDFERGRSTIHDEPADNPGYDRRDDDQLALAPAETPAQANAQHSGSGQNGFDPRSGFSDEELR
jgi:hypothetical protein